MSLVYAECPLNVRESLVVEYVVDANRNKDTQHSMRLMDEKDLKSALTYSMKCEATKTVSRLVRSMEILQYPRRLPPAKKEEDELLVIEVVDIGSIGESSGPWTSPIVLVKKKDGSTLMILC
ncbi:transposon Ty3-G Gag-Pol polyprotein [Nephila pilipes]|uniref:Transposon Ty3-G Gag-Pol polyprotein n=1 Tax=Nephila pilipes TaxID=299642 RepID=A0A8X6NKA3_NEPPI|nr:transposon Ty3-G Gag-Pol polyprotein [Nephila pilipes]